MAGSREGFVDGDLDGGQFGGGHAGEVEEVEAAVDEGDVEVCVEVRSACFWSCFVTMALDVWSTLG